MLQTVPRAFVFVQPFSRNYPVNLTPFLTPEADDGQSDHFFHFVKTRFNGQMLVFQNPQFMLSIPIYIFYGVLRSPGGQF